MAPFDVDTRNQSAHTYTTFSRVCLIGVLAVVV